MKKLKNFTINLSLVIISLLAMLIIAELILRPFYPSQGTSHHNRIPHPQWGWSLAPNTEYINYLPEGEIPVQYNAEGWRDIIHPKQKEHGEYRVLVLGDSFMEAYSVQFEAAFHRVIGRLFTHEHPKTSSINMAAGGYGTLQEYLVYRQAGIEYSPDLVLLGFYLGNDLENNSTAFHNKNSPLKSNRPYLIMNAHNQWSITQPDYQAAQARFQAARSSLSFKLEATSALNRAIISTREKLQTMKYGAKETRTEKINARNYGMHFCHALPQYTKAWEVTHEVLRRLKKAVNQQGARLVIFSVPALHEVDNALLQQIEAHTDNVCLQNPPGYQLLKKHLNNLDIEYVDLLPVFRQTSAGNGDRLFHLSDRHWNAHGHQLAAETVFNYLKQNDTAPE